MRDCVKVAALQLEYPGTLRPSAAAALAGGISGGGGLVGVASGHHPDLSAMHAAALAAQQASRIEGMVAQRVSGAVAGLSGPEQVLLLVAVMGALWLIFTRLQRHARRSKEHGRAE